jgi:hypothetical protein
VVRAKRAVQEVQEVQEVLHFRQYWDVRKEAPAGREVVGHLRLQLLYSVERVVEEEQSAKWGLRLHCRYPAGKVEAEVLVSISGQEQAAQGPSSAPQAEVHLSSPGLGEVVLS